MELFTQVYIERITDEELTNAVDLAATKLFSEYNSPIKNIPNSNIISEMVNTLVENATNIFVDYDCCNIEFTVNKNDLDLIEKLAFDCLVDCVYDALNKCHFDVITDKHTDDMDHEIYSVEDCGQALFLYKSPTWSSYMICDSKLHLQ